MKAYYFNTIWKRQLRTLASCSLALGILGFALGLFLVAMNVLSGKPLPRSAFFEASQALGGYLLMAQVFVSGLLLGAEEEENQTHSFVLRLPVSKARWVLERLLAALLAFIALFVLLVIEDALFASYLHVSNFQKDFIRTLSEIFSPSNVIAGFMYFSVSAFLGALIKKVLPAAGASFLMVSLIFILLAKLGSRDTLWAMRNAPPYFFLFGIVFLGLYVIAIWRREGT
jgi:ABC-type transport system involved in multi-copper enzyme maturation permease subunit